MRLIYIANMRLPTEKAHGIQIMKMCEAFALSGIEVELVVPWRFNPMKEDPFEYYGVEKNFEITKLPCIDLMPLARFLGRLAFWIQSFSFAKSAFWYAFFKKADIIYSRDVPPLFFLSFFKRNLVWENHNRNFNFIVRRVLKKCRKIIVITKGLKDFYISKGAELDKILVAPDGVDIEKFNIDISKEKARQKLNLPLDKILIGYAGMFRTMGMEKGIDVAVKTLNYLDEQHILVLVGGRNKDIEFYQKLAKDWSLEDRVLFIGQVKHREVPFYLKAFDVLIAPFPDNEHYRLYMSPLKIFEYMASQRPIAASDLPSLREVLNEENSVLIEPDNPRSLAEGVKNILQNADLADKISKQAYSDVQKYTWEKRAERILGFVSEKV